MKTNETPNDQCHRETAKGVLLNYANRLREKADGLEALAKVIPNNLDGIDFMADEALWQLVVTARNS